MARDSTPAHHPPSKSEALVVAEAALAKAQASLGARATEGAARGRFASGQLQTCRAVGVGPLGLSVQCGGFRFNEFVN